MTEATHITPTPDAGAPPPDSDAAKHDELRKELGIEAEGAEPEPAPEPEQRTEPELAPEPQHVPRAEHENVQRALREARESAQAAKAEKAAILQLIEQARARQQPPEKTEAPKVPDEQEDPIGHFKAINSQLVARLDAIERGGQQTAQHLQEKAYHDQLLQIVQHSESHITSDKNPEVKADYWDACAYLEGQRDRELVRMYPDGSPYVQQYAQQQGFRSAAELRQSVLNHDRWAVATQAVHMGISPAEVYYALATDRGYQPKGAKPNGKDVSLVEKAKQQLEANKRGAKSSVTLSGDTGGKKGAQDMSYSDLADLAIEDPAAFDKAWDHMQKLGRLG